MAKAFLTEGAYNDVKQDVEILSEFFEMEAGKSKDRTTYIALMEMIKPYLMHSANGTMHILGDEPLDMTHRALLEMGRMRKSLG